MTPGRLASAWQALVGKLPPTVAKMRQAVKAAYYAAASDSASMDFSFAKDVGINAALVADLQRVRTRCRYELKQNGLAKGMPRVYANSVIGTGPRLKIVCDDPIFSSAAERVFSRWSATSDMMTGGSLGMQLHLSTRQFFPTGEYFLTRRQAAAGLIRLRYIGIRPDRVKTPGSASKSAIIDNGVEVDRDGVPVAYHVMVDDPDNGTSASDKFVRVAAADMIHVFYREDPIQHRGEPWLATSLPVFHKLRRYDEATVAAAIVASKFAAYLVNLNPGAVESAGEILPSEVIDLQDGTMMVPPPGYEPRQLDPKQPTANGSDFRRDQLASAGAANAMPANIVTQDSSRSNFASARFDGVTLQQDGYVLRKIIEDLHLSRALDAMLAEAIAAGVIAPTEAEFAPLWLWDEEERHSDPLKAANSAKVRVQTGLSTVAQVNMEAGYDGETAFKALKAEVDRWRAAGLAHPLDASAPQAPAEAPEVPQDEQNDTEENTQEPQE